MGQFSSFDGLPIIVHDGILRSLASPRDVANTIRASPGSLQSFMTGGRRVVLLAAMWNFLSLENQHLMNLIIAAPHYYKHGETENTVTMSTCVEFDGVSRADFDRDVNKFLHSFHLSESEREVSMLHLTLNTFECFIRLYAIMDREIRNYNVFTLARAKGQVHTLSDPTTFRLTAQLTACDQPAPNNKEMQRIWRGFLLYELLCVMHGQPMVTADVDNSQLVREDEDLTQCFRGISQNVREEFVCVQQYVLEQYHLALNTVVESFRLAVNEMGRRTTGSTPPSTELLEDNLPDAVQYLTSSSIDHPYDPSGWATLLAMLGVSFMHEFLSWDSTTRLDFIRTTYSYQYAFRPRHLHDLFHPDIKMRVAMDQRFGWPRSQRTIDETNVRLRAVGWIFWEDPDRLAAMNLVRGAADKTYDSDEHGIIPYIKLDYRPSRKERSPKPQEWDRIVQEFGEPSYHDQLFFDVPKLFLSIGDLKPGRITEMVSAWRHQGVAGAQAEAKDNND